MLDEGEGEEEEEEGRNERKKRRGEHGRALSAGGKKREKRETLLTRGDYRGRPAGERGGIFCVCNTRAELSFFFSFDETLILIWGMFRENLLKDFDTVKKYANLYIFP